MPEENVVIKIQIGGFAVEVSGSAKFAESKIDELLKKYGPSQTLSEIKHHDNKSNPANTKGKVLSASEFIKKLSPKNHSERALALGYFLEKHKKMESFTTGDLISVRAEAKQSKFTNISDTIARLVQQGLVMGAGEKDGKRAYALTTTGEEAVEVTWNSKQEE